MKVNRRNSKTSASDILLKKDPKDKAVTKKPPSGSDASGGGSGYRDSKRLSGSCSSSSLAMLVATSGLDLYEKYSPTHYKPNTQLDSGSRSALNEAGTDLDERRTTAGDTTTANISLERPRISRFSRINSRNDSDETDNIASATLTRRSLSGTRASGRLSASNSNSNLNASDSTEDVPTATFTLRSNRLRKSKIANDEDKKPLRNGLVDGETKKKYTTEPSVITTSTITSNGIDTIAYVKLNKLQISEPKVDLEDNTTTQSSSYITKSGSSSKLKTSSSHDSIATDLLDVNSSSYSSSRNKTDENNDLENNDINKVITVA